MSIIRVFFEELFILPFAEEWERRRSESFRKEMIQTDEQKCRKAIIRFLTTVGNAGFDESYAQRGAVIAKELLPAYPNEDLRIIFRENLRIFLKETQHGKRWISRACAAGNRLEMMVQAFTVIRLEIETAILLLQEARSSSAIRRHALAESLVRIRPTECLTDGELDSFARQILREEGTKGLSVARDIQGIRQLEASTQRRKDAA